MVAECATGTPNHSGKTKPLENHSISSTLITIVVECRDPPTRCKGRRTRGIVDRLVHVRIWDEEKDLRGLPFLDISITHSLADTVTKMVEVRWNIICSGA